PLRRLDTPAGKGSAKTDKKAPRAKRTREDRPRGSGEPHFGNNLVPKGTRMAEAVSIMGEAVVEGEVANDAVSVLGRTVIREDAKVGGDAVAVLGPLVSKGSIGRDAVGVLGGVEIDGPVGGVVVAIFGDLKLGPNAVIERDVVLVGGKLIKDPQAILRGKQVAVPFIGGFGDISWLTSWITQCVFKARPLAFNENLGWAWLVAVSFLGFYVLIALVLRGGIEKCMTTLDTRPGLAILSAFLTVLLSPVVMVLLVATVVGLVIVPFLATGLIVAKLVGKAVMLAWLGRRLTRFLGEGPFAHPAVAVLVGGVIVMLLYTVPVFGFLLYKTLSWLGLGVVVLTIALAMRRERPPAPVFAVSAYAAAAPPMTSPAGAPAALGFAAAESAVGAPAQVAPGLPAVTLARAGFWIRTGALALDGLLIGMLLGFMSSLVPRALQIGHGPGGLLLALAVYAAIMWKQKGTTIGGIVCGLKVVRLDSRELDWATAIVRALGCFLSMIVVGLGFIWVAFDPERQSWHDKIAGTVVVRVPKGVSLL
ncbi:MAG: RDD family protein, partial [Verrucomicrobia bacterium]|nr:RDD family protein [Verrucomicrobiota bacterium]